MGELPQPNQTLLLHFIFPHQTTLPEFSPTHSIPEWLRSEGTSGCTWPNPRSSKEHQCTQHCIQEGCGDLQGGYSAASRGNLCLCFVTLMVRNFPLCSDRHFCVPVSAQCLPSCHWVSLKKNLTLPPRMPSPSISSPAQSSS